ncbi:MAG: M3 family metallopeptidase [Rhodothermales bacterium]
MATQADAATNPLLQFEGLPAFESIKPEHVVPAITSLIDRLEKELDALEHAYKPTWEGLILPLERLEMPFEYAWGPIHHLLNVMNSTELRAAHEEVQPAVVSLSLRMRQSAPIYEGLAALQSGPEWAKLDEGQRRVVELRLRSARHAGVALEGDAKARFTAIEQELSKLTTDFSNHVLDATKAFELIVTDAADTDGWPASLKHLAAASYAQARPDEGIQPDAQKGPWRITLDFPSFGPFMQHSRRRDQRKTVYLAYITRASDGPLDNRGIIERILTLRQEKARLLGFDTYAELSLDAKMAPDVDAVFTMLDELKGASLRHARKDLDELRDLAKANGQTEPVAHWDLAFWSERLQEQRFQFTDEELRPYFPLERVLEGLFGVCERLFGITVREVANQPNRWHKDVRFYDVLNEAGQVVASFFLDPYSRPENKRGGAWMDNCLDRRWIDGKLRTPVVHLCCNGTPPVGDTPSLMSFREVETLFHEFGHGLQGMLTTVDYVDVAGINGVEWDAVELASQFMENWCYHKPTLTGMTAHYQTGAPLPDALFEKLCAARTFRSGSVMLRQLLFGATDMTLHHRYHPGEGKSAFDVYKTIAKDLAVLPPLEEDRFLCSFSHIFAGGYAAGYYSYKWAEVLSADAFAAFEEAGLDDDAAVRRLGRTYRDTILALGGSRHPMAVFTAFRGREPSTHALLRHAGLTNGEAAAKAG